MEQDSETGFIYAEQIRSAVFGANEHDLERGGPLSACVVFGPTGAGKKDVALRAEQWLQSHGLKTVTIDHAALWSAHPERDSLNQGDIDRTICRWRDTAIGEAAQRKLGVVITAPLESRSEAVTLLDSLQAQGYKAFAFAVCTPETQRTGVMHPNRSERDHASYTDLGNIADTVKNHSAVVKLSLVSRQCESFSTNGSVSQGVRQAREALLQEARTPALVGRRSSSQLRNERGR